MKAPASILCSPQHRLLSESPLARLSSIRCLAMAHRDRAFEDAIRVIKSRQRGPRPDSKWPTDGAVPPSIDPSGTPDLRGEPSVSGMSEWLNMLGYTDADINSLNVIHIAGTKGKGSTCSFTESFLRAHGERTGFPRKTGLYTSPHLIVPEERIRIDFKPLDQTLFAKYFFEVYDKLPQLATTYNHDASLVERGPRNLQIYALLAFHIFLRERVDVAIIETHHGGEYCATNFVQKPVVTAITALGMDHVAQLGPSIENIAWHKSGIFKEGAVALSTVQDRDAAQVLERRARDKGVEIRFIEDDSRLPTQSTQLKVKVQRENASLAAAVAQAFLHQVAPQDSRELTEEDLERGVKQWSWPGRFQIIEDGQRTWFLDAAHNELSLRIAAEWFAETGAELNQDAMHVLVFAHTSKTRDAIALLRTLAEALRSRSVDISHVVFTTYDGSVARNASQQSDVNEAFQDVWQSVYADTRVWTEPTIHGALKRVVSFSEEASGLGVQTLLTGSQRLVGPALRILQEELALP